MEKNGSLKAMPTPSQPVKKTVKKVAAPAKKATKPAAKKVAKPATKKTAKPAAKK